MPKFTRVTEARHREILRRQDPPAWGKAYEPAIRAVREEAPSDSRPSTAWWEKMRREVHVLSLPELWVLVIVLYFPWLWELQEQRMLPFLPAKHPLSGHARAIGMTLPVMNGTLAVAERLGVLKLHPVLYVRTVGNDLTKDIIPGAWIGDLLAYLEDDDGPFCVNLSVKNTRLGFSRPVVGTSPKTKMKEAEEKELARQLVEVELYNEVGIPTHQIAGDELNEIVVANLLQILLWQKRTTDLPIGARLDLIGELNEGITTGKSALEVLTTWSRRNQKQFYDAKIVLYQAIWNRELRVDLFQYFFIEQPLVPETRDVLDQYGHWFRRPRP